MKRLNKYFIALGVAATAFGLSSCTGDLDLQPNNPQDNTDVSKNMDNVFADVYMNFATYGPNGSNIVQDFDGGQATFARALFMAEEFPTDEACWLWDPEQYGTINYGLTDPSTACVYAFYSRLMINISLCNQFIQCVNNGTFELSEADQARAQDYVRQCRILRNACYFYMMTFYDKIPYADESTVMGAQPTQLPRAEVYQLVTADLEQIVASFEANQKPYYGFVGLDAAESILAKIYLNGEVFAGRADYDKCYQHSKNVIARLGQGGYYGNGLARSYKRLFGANNDKVTLGSNGEVNEIIWTIPQDNENLTSYAGATFMICGWLGTNGVQQTVAAPTMDASLTEEQLLAQNLMYCATQAEYDAQKAIYDGAKDWEKTVSETINGKNYSFDPKATGYIASEWFNSGDGWKCMVARSTFVSKFEWNDTQMSQSDDVRVALWQTSSHGFTVNNPSLVGDDWGKNGYIAPKFSNWAYNEDGTINYVESPDNRVPVGGDYGMIRLAEVYLMAAEASLMGGGGSASEATEYVNYIRRRAYGLAPGDTSKDLAGVAMGDLQDERCRELYHELTRRTDLIRWNLWCSGYTWPWKGGVERGTSLPEYTKCYPLPTRVMSTSDFEQTTGY